MAKTPLMELVCQVDDLIDLSEFADHFKLVRTAPSTDTFYLSYAGDCLSLHRRGDDLGVFVAAREITRRLQGDFLLGRACGIRKGRQQLPLTVLDATAGLGLDGLALARCGAAITLVERNLVLWALLHNLLTRLDAGGVPLLLGDCSELLTLDSFDVIYLDPMFNRRAKSALPGKRMQYLGELLEHAPAFDESLIEIARERARSRVVLKRRLKDPPLAQPDWTIKGRSIRYDVYRGRFSG